VMPRSPKDDVLAQALEEDVKRVEAVTSPRSAAATISVSLVTPDGQTTMKVSPSEMLEEAIRKALDIPGWVTPQISIGAADTGTTLNGTFEDHAVLHGSKITVRLPKEEMEFKMAEVRKEGALHCTNCEQECDMLGEDFFTTTLDEPEGDLSLLELGVAAMDAEPAASGDLTGGTRCLGKVVFSAGTHGLAMVCTIPEDKLAASQQHQAVSAEEWLRSILAALLRDFLANGGDARRGDVVMMAGASATYALASLVNSAGTQDDHDVYLAMRDDAIVFAYHYLQECGCVRNEDDELDGYGEDECVEGADEALPEWLQDGQPKFGAVNFVDSDDDDAKW